MPTASPGVARDDFVREFRSAIDGPRSEIPNLIDVLVRLGLVFVQSDHYWLSAKGKRARGLSDDRSRRELSQLLIQQGFLHDQVRQLIEASTIQGDGRAHSSVRLLQQSAPQLLGILREWPGVVGPSFVSIPSDMFDLIGAPWSLVPPTGGEIGAREMIGRRAESYSYQFLRLSSSQQSTIIWVSLDDQQLGYDIEDRSTQGISRIEVKGSQSQEVRFVLSANEHKVAHQHPESYAVHFWGEINPHRDPNVEYDDLVQKGFPCVFQDLAAHLCDRRLEATPISYQVTVRRPST